MRIATYAPEHAEALARAFGATDDGRLLRSPAFLRHYFLGHPRCRLHLLLGDDGAVLATFGLVMLQIRWGNETHELAFGSNTYSLKPGAFSFLLLHWMKTCEFGALMPGTKEWSDIVARHSRWRAMAGLRAHFLNWDFPAREGEAALKRLAKPVARHLARVDPAALIRRVAGERRAAQLEAREVDHFTEDMIRRDGPFGLRVQGDLAYFNWRYSTHLDYVRYRLFRILSQGVARGCVVIAEWPDRLVVSHCDGDDPEELALAVVLAVAAVNVGANRHRKVALVTMHAGMAVVFRRFGFRAANVDKPFYLAAFGPQPVPFEAGGDWLVNLGWGDSDLVH